MASSFLEDLFEKEVDEKEVSAMVGSLESQLASTPIPRSHHNEVKPSVEASKTSPKISNMTSKAPIRTSPIQNQTATAVRPGISSSPVLNTTGNTAITTVINIAPRPTVTTAVPLAPRPATMAVLAAPNAAFAGGHRFVTTMINSTDLINRNINILNPQQIALAPRIVSGNAAVPGNPQTMTAPRIIQQIQPRVVNAPRVLNPQVVLRQPATSSPVQQDQKMNIIQTQIRPVPASVSVTQNVPIRTNLTQIRPQQINAIPRTVTYRMPINQASVTTPKTEIASTAGTNSHNSSSSNVANVGMRVSTPTTPQQQGVKNITIAGNQTKPQPSSTPLATVTHSQPQVNAAQLEQVKEQALKLKNFFNNLVRLASEKSPDVGKTVKELVQGVMEGKLTEEQFATNLQTTLNSPPQPNLVGFLKKTLPLLRAQSRSPSTLQLLQQVPQSINPQKILPQQQVQPKTGTPTHTTSPQVHKQNGPSPLQKIQIVQRGQQVIKLTPEQQQLLLRQHQINAQRVLLTTSGATSGSQVATSSRNVVMVHAPPGTTGAKMVVTSPRSQAGTSVASSAAADKLKPKGFTGISSSGDDDINDVTSMAGVNLMEESQRILAINSDLLSSQTRSCKDEPFLNVPSLQRKLDLLAKKHGLTDVSQDVVSLVSHATQERLRNILEKISTISLHRLEVYRDDPIYEVGVDIRSQLRVFEQIDEVERKKRDARERDILMRAAKSRSRQEDPEQARLKEKAKQLQQEEEELIRKRAANSTALAAIGPRKKRKLDEALEGSSSSSTPGSSSTSASPSSSSVLGNQNDVRKQVPRQRMRRVLLKDLIFVMEQEKETTKSLLLYKALLK
ncbi:transcription initiation factor TFIID subunit 4-like isoform X2 [Porites lutea]|uniref:transcription initiation factor TFIID subunit 4-like isoform X2 n=1 Tax=Porites lutea TaxID=51062 RepID=UPI003CC56BAD